MAEYNAQGIEIRYLSYPRSGPNSESFRKAEAEWCSADRKTALTPAKLGAPVDAGAAGLAGEQCENVVHREWDLGNDFGLRGPPLKGPADISGERRGGQGWVGRGELGG